MSDVADMLGIANQPKQQLTAGEEATKLLLEKPKAVNADKKKKPKGMKREVFDLIAKDGIAPSVQTTSMNPVFKSKRQIANEGKWTWAPIENSARSDNLKALCHWVRADKFYPDYPYAQFNVKMDKITFTDEQYSALLEQPGWSKEDTMVLLETSRDYDLRWPVIADRISLSTDKKSEELQARYYFVYNAIQQANATTNAPSFGNPVSVKMYNYDLEKEAYRRKKQDQLYYRTKEEEKEEVKLREELKFINEQLKKLKKTIKTSARETASSAAAISVKSENATSSSSTVEQQKVTQYLAEGKAILDATTSNPIDGTDATSSVSVAARELAPQPGKPALQSCRLYMTGQHPIGKAVFTKMNSYLRELNIPERPVPTKRVCDLVDTIRRDTQALLALQNQLKKKEKDVAQAKTGAFKNVVGNGRTSAEQALAAGKAIMAKAEKASKPKSAPKPRSLKKDAVAANSSSTGNEINAASEISGGDGITVKSEPLNTSPSAVKGSSSNNNNNNNKNLTDLLDAFSPTDTAMDIDNPESSIFDVLPSPDKKEAPTAASRKRNRSKMA